MNSELEKLVELQKTDTNIRKLKKSIETADKRRAALESEFEKHAFEIREIQAKRDTAQAERAKLEAEIAENKTYLERADRNLKHAQNQKEYESAMRETDALQKQIAALEAQVLEKMNVIEEVEGILAERADEIAGMESKRETALNEFDAQIEQDRAALEEALARRNEVFVTLPANMAKIYNRLVERSRDGIAVAEVRNESCSACFMKLRPQVVMELKRGDQIITCESCTRILYIAPKEAASAAPEN